MDVGEMMRRCRLRWHGHVERKDDADCVKACARLAVEHTAHVGRPRKTWQYAASAVIHLVDPLDIQSEMEGHRSEPSRVWNTASKRK